MAREVDGLVVGALEAVGGVGAGDSSFFHGFVAADVSFGKGAVFLEEHADAQADEGQSKEYEYDDEDGK